MICTEFKNGILGSLIIKKIFLVQTTPQSIGLTAHRTGTGLETKEAFKTERSRVSNGSAFFF